MAGLVACMMIVSLPVSASMAAFTVGSPLMQTAEENGVAEKTLEAAPYIKEGRTMVPVRAIGEALGAQIGWQEAEQKVTASLGDTEIALYIGQSRAEVGGETKTLDAPPQIVEGRTFVPLRFISEAFSCNVRYIAATSQILVEDSPVVMTCGTQTASLEDCRSVFAYLYKGYESQKGAMEEGAFEEVIAQLAIQTMQGHLRIRAAFPAAYLSEQDAAYIREDVEAALPIIKPAFSASLAQVLENAYYQNGVPILEQILREQDVTPIYEQDFVCAKHILVSDQETADAVYEKAARGEDFDGLIGEYNEDPGMSQNPDGYIFTKGEMVGPFEEAAFAAKTGEITKPVETEYGYHIIKRLPLPAPGEETRAKIAVGLAQEILSQSPVPEMVLPLETVREMLLEAE